MTFGAAAKGEVLKKKIKKKRDKVRAYVSVYSDPFRSEQEKLNWGFSGHSFHFTTRQGQALC